MPNLNDTLLAKYNASLNVVRESPKYKAVWNEVVTRLTENAEKGVRNQIRVSDVGYDIVYTIAADLRREGLNVTTVYDALEVGLRYND